MKKITACIIKYYFLIMLLILVFCISSCSDTDNTIDICWEGILNNKVEEKMPILLDTREQFIGKSKTIIENDEIKNLYDSAHYVLSKNQFRKLYSLLSDRTMRHILNDGGHYSYDGFQVSPVSTYRLTVYYNNSQQIITYDSSILGASNSDLKCLYDLHMFLNESVTNADGYDRLLSDYQSYISPFD